MVYKLVCKVIVIIYVKKIVFFCYVLVFGPLLLGESARVIR